MMSTLSGKALTVKTSLMVCHVIINGLPRYCVNCLVYNPLYTLTHIRPRNIIMLLYIYIPENGGLSMWFGVH